MHWQRGRGDSGSAGDEAVTAALHKVDLGAVAEDRPEGLSGGLVGLPGGRAAGRGTKEQRVGVERVSMGVPNPSGSGASHRGWYPGGVPLCKKRHDLGCGV